MAPPELTRNAPVLDVFQPLVIGGGPVFRHELNLALAHHVERDFGDRAARMQRAGGSGLAHRDKPLVGQHRLDYHAGAVAARHHQLVRLDRVEQAGRFQIRHHLLARVEAVETLVAGRRVLVDLRVQCQDFDDGQVMALADLIVVQVVRGRDLDHAGAEFAVDIVVGDDGDLAVGQRQAHGLADQCGVALVFRMHHHRDVAQQRFGPRGGDRQVARAVRERIVDVPQRAVLFLADHFKVGHRGHQDRIPVHQALAAIDQTLFIELDEHAAHRSRHFRVHREIFARPVDRGAQAAHLAGDGRAGLFLPFPHALDEFLAAEVVARQFLRVELAFDHDLRGNACMVGTGQPQGVRAAHAVIARQAVHDGLVEGVTHVQRAGDVGRRQLDGEVLAPGFERRLGIAALFPFRPPVRFDGLRLEALGQCVGGGRGCGDLIVAVAHGEFCRVACKTLDYKGWSREPAAARCFSTSPHKNPLRGPSP